jgi:hypothetical protein
VWWAGSNRTCQLYVERTGCRWLDPQGAVRHVAGSEAQLVRADWWSEMFSQLPKRSGLPLLRRPVLKVWLSGYWARPFVLDLPAGVKPREWAAVAAARAGAATGLDGPCQVVVQSPGSGVDATGLRVLAVAVPQGLLAAQRDGARASGVTLESIRPWWAGALDEVLRGDSALNVFSAVDADAVVMLVSSSNGWSLATTCSPPPAGDAMERWFKRQSLGLPSDARGSSAARHVEAITTAPAPRSGLWPVLSAHDSGRPA